MRIHAQPSLASAAAVASTAFLVTGFLAAPFVAPPSLNAQTAKDSLAAFTGRVMSATTGGPLQGVQIRLEYAGLGTVTDSTGTFQISNAPPGPDTVTVSRVGLGEQSAAITLRPGRTTDVVFLLSEKALRLEDIHVSVTPERDQGKLSGFYRRKEAGLGYFITPEEVEERNAQFTSDLLRRVPGVQVSADYMGRTEARMTRGGRECPPAYWVDGISVRSFRIDEIQPDDILAIEIYRGPSEVPAEFASPFSDGCGAVVVWTRAGQRQRR